MREFPALDITLAIEGTLHGSNQEVSNLSNMMPHARHDVLIVADSDARRGHICAVARDGSLRARSANFSAGAGGQAD